MSPADDESTEMHKKPLDSSTADRLLSGGVAPGDAPPGLRDLARLIQAAKPLAWAGGGVLEEQVVAAFAAALRTPVDASESVYEAKKRMLTNWLSVKTAAIAAVGAAVVFGGGAVAAATGSLPGPVQSAVSGALSHVGISVPNPDSHHAPQASGDAGTTNSHGSPAAGGGAGTANSQAGGQNGSGSGQNATAFGQCTAWAAATKGTNSASGNAQDKFPQLTADAKAQGETVAQFCANVSPPPATTTPSSSDGSSGTGAPSTPNGQPSSTPGGPPLSTPDGPPSSVPGGPPTSVPHGPPSSVPNGHPSSTPDGPPTSVPGGPPTSVPHGPPSSVPNGPPTSTPNGPPSSVPGGPPSSLPSQSHGGGATAR